MTIRAVTPSGKGYTFSNPLTVSYKSDIDAPADSLDVTFACTQAPEELATATAYDGDTLFFAGVVDEQIVSASAKGCLLTLKLRSLAAMLLDNESIPCVYYDVCLADLAVKHLKPYGLTLGNIPNRNQRYTSFVVRKGMSEWDVIERFCLEKIGVRILVDESGTLVSKSAPEGFAVRFGNGGAGARPYLSASVRNKRCDAVGSILVKTAKDSGYTVAVESPAARARGITARHLLDVSGGTAIPAEVHLQRANFDLFSVSVIVNGAPPALLWNRAAFEDARLGRFENLLVSSVHFTQSADGAQTQLVLADSRLL